MSKKDIILKELLSDPIRFADLFNGTLFNGKKILNPNNLHPLSNESALIINQPKNKMTTIQRFRDVIKKYSNNTEFVILACENQTETQYAMPVRNMIYDALTYVEQVKSIEKQHTADKDLKGSAEFLSKFKKDDSIIPVINLILYYGVDQWDGSIDLHGMMNFKKNSRYIKKYVSNYKMNLLNISDIVDLNKYNSDLRELFGMIKYSSDNNKMKEYVASNKKRFSNLDDLTYTAISTFLDNKNYLKNIKNKIKTEDGGYNMCVAFDQMIEEGIEIGMERGIERGMERGREEGKRIAMQSIALALADILDIPTISNKTGLTIEEIEELIKKNYK